MATDLGKVGMVMKGNYNSANTYEVLDVVSYSAGLYVAKQAVPAGTAPSNTTYWQPAINYSNAKVDISSSFTISTSNALLTSINVKAYLTGNLVCFNIAGICNNGITPQGKNICDIASAYKPVTNIPNTGMISKDYTDANSDIVPVPITLDSTNSKINVTNQGGLNYTLGSNARLLFSGCYFI